MSCKFITRSRRHDRAALMRQLSYRSQGIRQEEFRGVLAHSPAPLRDTSQPIYVRSSSIPQDLCKSCIQIKGVAGGIAIDGLLETISETVVGVLNRGRSRKGTLWTTDRGQSIREIVRIGIRPIAQQTPRSRRTSGRCERSSVASLLDRSAWDSRPRRGWTAGLPPF